MSHAVCRCVPAVEAASRFPSDVCDVQTTLDLDPVLLPADGPKVLAQTAMFVWTAMSFQALMCFISFCTDNSGLAYSVIFLVVGVCVRGWAACGRYRWSAPGPRAEIMSSNFSTSEAFALEKGATVVSSTAGH